MFEVPGSDVVEVIVTPEAVRGTKDVEYVRGRAFTTESEASEHTHSDTRDARSA